MALTASDPGQTSRGDELADDRYIATFKVVRQVPKINAVPATEKGKGRDERAAHTLVTIGNCEDLTVDAEKGFVSITDILHYTGLLCTSDLASLKKAVTAWFKKPTATAISQNLIQRDQGTSQFMRKEDEVADYFIHPIQLLANIEVGVNTRTWLVSVAAFVLSYHQLSKAYEESPKDFAKVEEHIDNLQTRVAMLNDEACISRLVESALSKVKSPYSDFDYRTIALDAVSRLSLLARADLETLKHIQKLVASRTTGKKKGSTSSSDTAESSEVTIEHLRYLQEVMERNGDLWTPRSAHIYNSGEQCGALAVFPSGYIYSIVGSPGMTGQQLMHDRSALSCMESLIPYVPYELSGYSGSLASLAKLEAEHRGKKMAAKLDLEAARLQIAAYTARLTTFMVTDPILLSLAKKPVVPARKLRTVAPAPVPESDLEETPEEDE